MGKAQPSLSGSHTLIRIALACACVVCSPSLSFGYSLATTLSINGISQCQVFDNTLGTSGQWALQGQEGAEFTSISTSSLLSDEPFDMWTINPYGTQLEDGKLRWVGNPLVTDSSTGVPPTSKAEATFGSGGVLEIWGDLYDLSYTQIADDALLLRATVHGFRLQERGPTTNTMDTIGMNGEPGWAEVVPTGGLLYAENSDAIPGLMGPGLGFFGIYDLSISIAGAANWSSGTLDNFQDGIDVTSGVQFTMTFNRLPEPASALLVVLGGLVTFWRKRRGR